MCVCVFYEVFFIFLFLGRHIIIPLDILSTSMCVCVFLFWFWGRIEYALSIGNTVPENNLLVKRWRI